MAKNEIQSESDFFPISRTPVLNKPAVSDGSGLIIFVDIDNNLRMLQANPNNPSETILDSSGVWWGAAIGPGLTSLALTSKYADTTIYYFDLVNEVSTAFKIATKSYDAADVRTALYADALSFDPTGQYLLFDSYNEIKNASGGKLSFWTINNLAINTGKMESVFPPLPEGINVGNPSFSKTSQTRFTFDYWDENKAEDYVMAADFNTGKSGIVAGPLSVIGYPSYSGDDKIIAFHATESYQGTTHDAVNKMTLKDNMIEGTGTPQGYVVDATYPSWFVIGTRTTGTKDKPGYIPASFILSQNYPNPFNPTTAINYAIPKSSFVTIKVYDILGNEVAALVSGMKASGNYKVEFNASKLSSGVYFYRIQAGSFVKTKKLILLK
jgi:hypothetical protein